MSQTPHQDLIDLKRKGKFMGNYYSQVKKKIHALVDSMGDSEFFASRQYRDYVARTVDAICRDVGRRAELRTIQDPDFTACTNGNEIIVNTEGPLVAAYDKRFMKHRAIMGLTEHELAHVLFTDFPTFNRARDAIAKGEWYPDRPYQDGPHPEENVRMDEITDLIQNKPGIGGLFAKVWYDILNIVEDAYIELRMCDRYPGFSRDIAAINVMIYEENKFIDEEEAAIKEDASPIEAAGERLRIILNALLAYAKFGTIKVHDGYSSELFDALYCCIDRVDSAICNPSATNRASCVNEIVVVVWPFVKELLEAAEQLKQNSGNSEKKGNQSGQSAADQVAEILRQLLEQMTENKGGADPQNRNTRPVDGRINDANAARSQATGGQGRPLPSQDNGSQVSSGSDPKDVEGSKKDSSKSQNSKGEAAGQNGKPANQSPQSQQRQKAAATPQPTADEQRQLENLARQIATAIAEGQVAAQQRADIQSEIGGFSGCENVRVDRPVQVTPDMVRDYNKTVHGCGKDNLLQISKKMQRQLMVLFKTKIEGGKQTRLPMGNRISTKDLIRGDDYFFERRRLPQDKADLSVCVLIDESGSMSGSNRVAAIKTAIVLEDFLRNMHIPCCIFGHTDLGGCLLTCYTDFDKVDQRDRYRIMALRATGGTPTAHALRACYGRMAKREEGNKLIIVITDGCPGDNSGGQIQTMIRESHRKNIDIFGVGIAGCAKYLEAIYGGRTIAIDDLNELPGKMAALVKRHVRFV